jgi:nucleoside-diphosphate-sugar epimerase
MGVNMAANPLSADLDYILGHARSLWDDLRGERLWITGGTGFFGCWLLESFAWANDRLNLGAQAVVLSRNPRAFEKKAPHLYHHSAIRFHTGDVRNFQFPEGAFTFIIHAATDASARMNQEDPLLMLDTIVQGTRHMLDFAIHCGARKFLLTSSGAIYGQKPPETTHISEDYPGAPDPTDPGSAYGQGKRHAEHLCVLYARQYCFEIEIARCFAFVGPYLPLDIHFAIGNFIQDALNGGPIIVKGDGTPCRSYLYAADLAIWLWTILLRGQSCRPYNVGSAEAISIADLAHIVARAFDPPPAVNVLGVPDPNKLPERYVPFIDRISEELGLRQGISLVEGITRTIDYYTIKAKTV